MSTPPNPGRSIREWLTDSAAGAERFLWGAGGDVCLGRLLDRTSTSVSGRSRFAGRSVLIATRDPMDAALAMIELDGIARRLVVCTPDLPAEHLPAILENAAVDATVS